MLNNRKVLPDINGIICGLCFQNEPCFEKGYFTAFKDNGNILIDKSLDNNQKTLVYDFIDWYYDMIKGCNITRDPDDTDIKINYGKFNKVLGLCVFDYIKDVTTYDEKKEMWVDIINIMKTSYNFMDTIWNGLSKGDQRNCTKSGLTKRLERIREFYNDKEEVSKEYGIKY